MADNVATAWKFLRGKGLTPAQTAGVIGGLMGESGQGLSTTARNPTSGAYGIAQWLGGRKSGLLNRGDPTSIRTQLQYLWSELQGAESGAYGRVKQARTTGEATDAWVRAFERPSPSEISSSISARKQSAQNVL